MIECSVAFSPFFCSQDLDYREGVVVGAGMRGESRRQGGGVQEGLGTHPQKNFKSLLKATKGIHKAYQLPSKQSCFIAIGICIEPSQTHSPVSGWSHLLINTGETMLSMGL